MMTAKYFFLIACFFVFFFHIQSEIFQMSSGIEVERAYEIGLGNNYRNDSELIFLEYPVIGPRSGTNPLFEYSGFESKKNIVPIGWSVHSSLYQRYLIKKGLSNENLFIDIINNPKVIVISYLVEDERELYIKNLCEYLNRHYSKKYGNTQISMELLQENETQKFGLNNHVPNFKFYHIITTNLTIKIDE